MARFTDNQLKELKTNISLIALINSQGHDLKPQGNDHVMCCPFHDDKTPSLKVSIKKNIYHCFGCGAKGTVIDWVMQTQSVSFRHACEILADDAGMNLSATSGDGRTPKLASLLATDIDNQVVMNQVINYYHQNLKQNHDALAYLKSRGLNNPELITTFKLGFANRTLGLRLPAKIRKAGKAIRGQLQQIGIYRKSGHEHFNGSLVVPIIDAGGNVLEVYGRKIVRNLRKGTPKHLYLPGQHLGVFNLASLKLSDEVILCESLIDALTFYNHGFRNVTSSYGTSGFTEDILTAFKTNNIKRVLIAYDRDDAGNKAAGELSVKLNQQNIDTYRIEFPAGMDANDYSLLKSDNGVQHTEGGANRFGHLIRKASWMGVQKTGDRTQMTDNKKLANKEKLIPLASHEQLPEPSAHVMPKAGSNQKTDDRGQKTELPEPSAKVMPNHSKETDAEITEREVLISFGQRKYRIRGLAKNLSYEQLKLNIHVSKDELYYIDTFDLYHAKARVNYIKQASMELGVENNTIKKELGKILVKLEELQEQQIKSALNTDEKPAPSLTESEYTQAMELLKDPNLLERITQDLTTSGIIGENTNKLTAYLGCVSRKLDKPLAIIIQSTSAAGKSTLMDAVIEMMPMSEKVQYSAMTGQSLFYMGETSLKNKILAISEEEGAHNASYALKLLQSEGKITIASTGKDETSGNMETKEYSVQGPIMLFMTTTAIDIDEELMNRCLVLTVNESQSQTQAIHNLQRNALTLDGLKANSKKQQIIQLHQNAQILIKSLKVVNPFADKLTFMSNKTRTRRDHMKYLNLINTIALIHQHQRSIKNIEANGETINYIEVEISDIEWANKLAHIILGRTLDELPPQTRTLLTLLTLVKKMIESACQKGQIEQTDYRFSRRDIREFTHWSDSQLKTHCVRLTDMEYLLVHRGGRGHSIVYELACDGTTSKDQAHMMGLIDVKHLYDEQKFGSKALKSGQSSNKSTLSLGQVCPKSVGGLGNKNTIKSSNTNDSGEISTQILENARLGNKKTASNRTVHA